MVTEAGSASVRARVADLRSRAGEDPAGAKDAAWQWIADLKELAGRERQTAESELDALFRLGVPPTDLDGPTEGILVTTTTNKLLDPAVSAITKLWMPWQGKRFDAKAATGDNRMLGSGAVAGRLLWPFYKMRDAAGGKLAFDFKTYTEAGKADPDVQVMVIDYADVDSNPGLIIKSIRDELVEILPGAYLGKVLYRLPKSDRYEMVGFFALHT